MMQKSHVRVQAAGATTIIRLMVRVIVAAALADNFFHLGIVPNAIINRIPDTPTVTSVSGFCAVVSSEGITRVTFYHF